MLYFTAKKDLRTVEELFELEHKYVKSYWRITNATNDDVHLESNPPSEKALGNVQRPLHWQYDDYRRQILEQLTKMGKLADRYGVGHPTENLLTTTQLPDYKLTPTPGLFNDRDRFYWTDKMYTLIGAIKDRKQEEFKLVINPFYWVFAMFRSVFTMLGLSKLIGESITTLLSVGMTASTAILSPWIKHFIQEWWTTLLR